MNAQAQLKTLRPLSDQNLTTLYIIHAVRSMKLKRKKKQYHHPFLIQTEWGESVNLLWQLDYIPRDIEDIIIGCVRSLNAESKHRQNNVNWYKVFKLYRNVDELTRESVKSYLRCSDTQLTRYIKAVRLCNIFIKQYYRKHPDEKMP